MLLCTSQFPNGLPLKPSLHVTTTGSSPGISSQDSLLSLFLYFCRLFSLIFFSIISQIIVFYIVLSPCLLFFHIYFCGLSGLSVSFFFPLTFGSRIRCVVHFFTVLTLICVSLGDSIQVLPKDPVSCYNLIQVEVYLSPFPVASTLTSFIKILVDPSYDEHLSCHVFKIF